MPKSKKKKFDQKVVEKCLKDFLSNMDYQVYKKATRTFWLQITKVYRYVSYYELDLKTIKEKDYKEIIGEEFPSYVKTRNYNKDVEELRKVMAKFYSTKIIVSVEHLKLVLTEKEFDVLNAFDKSFYTISSFDEEPYQKIMGCTLGKFSFPVDFLGVGKNGIVFLINHQGVNRALKISEPAYLKDEFSGWEDECKYAKKAGDAGLGPKVLECDTCGVIGNPRRRGYMLQEALDGLPLSKVDLSKDLIFRVLDSYERLLNIGIIHRDVHAGNVMILKKEPSIRWIDYGQVFDVREESDKIFYMAVYARDLREDLYYSEHGRPNYTHQLKYGDPDWVIQWIDSHPLYKEKFDSLRVADPEAFAIREKVLKERERLKLPI